MIYRTFIIFNFYLFLDFVSYKNVLLWAQFLRQNTVPDRVVGNCLDPGRQETSPGKVCEGGEDLSLLKVWTKETWKIYLSESWTKIGYHYMILRAGLTLKFHFTG